MSSYVALLRGVNVGGKHPLPMATLKRVFGDAGFDDIQTFIQSGNVLFSSPEEPEAPALESALERECGFAIPIVIRTATTLGSIAASNPFADLDQTKLHVAFMAEKPSSQAVDACDAARFLPERFAFAGSDLYLFLPHGMARTKLPRYLARQVGVEMTVRNWNTVVALASMARP
ncbi:MAG TPA: DUF1697 domain-containing protein [Acidimicrobiales bacterium]|nr:DUF1697 domain-containing protein [Acidimicrobiales bacterium]